MKQQKFFGIILVFCVLVTLTGCASATTFDGSRVKNADSYQLDIKTMNCTDTHTLELKQGDTLKIEFETENGNLSMKITAPDGTALYQGGRNSEGIYRGGSYGRRLSHRRRGAEGKGQHPY